MGSVGVVFLCLTLLAVSASAQVDNRLEAYTGRNATGYLAPIVDAFRSNLNSALFYSAYVPPKGFHVSLEFNVMATVFGEDSRTFWATTEGDFRPVKVVKAPTVVGDPSAVYVTGDASTQFAFPGGFDVNEMYLTCPQVRVGSWKGTELVGRLILYDTGSSELGRLGVWGAGLRHSVSQYLPGVAPFDIALAAMWQHGELKNGEGQKVLDSELATFAVHSGVTAGPVYPYAGLSVAWYRMAVRYQFDAGSGLEPVALDFDTEAGLQLTLGLSYRVHFMAAFAEYDVARQNSLAAGVSVGFPFSSRSVTE